VVQVDGNPDVGVLYHPVAGIRLEGSVSCRVGTRNIANRNRNSLRAAQRVRNGARAFKRGVHLSGSSSTQARSLGENYWSSSITASATQSVYCSGTDVDLSAFLSLAMPSPNLHIKVTLLALGRGDSCTPSLHTPDNTYPSRPFTHSKSATQFLIAPD
jgi:hypothetical protein